MIPPRGLEGQQPVNESSPPKKRSRNTGPSVEARVKKAKSEEEPARTSTARQRTVTQSSRQAPKVQRVAQKKEVSKPSPEFKTQEALVDHLKVLSMPLNNTTGTELTFALKEAERLIKSGPASSELYRIVAFYKTNVEIRGIEKIEALRQALTDNEQIKHVTSVAKPMMQHTSISSASFATLPCHLSRQAPDSATVGKVFVRAMDSLRQMGPIKTTVVLGLNAVGSLLPAPYNGLAFVAATHAWYKL